MGKWTLIVENSLADIATETPGASGFRENIAHKLFEAEQIAARAERGFLGEPPAHRVNEIRERLSIAMAGRLKSNPNNEIWQNAKQLVDIPMLRATQDPWPWDGR